MNSIAPVAQAKEHKRSFGERVFDIVTYGGIAGVGTFIASALTGYCARYGTARPLARWATEKLAATKMLSHSAAEDAVLTTSLMAGGFATLPGVKVMENNKEKLITCIDHLAGKETDMDSLREQPKVSMWNLTKSRLVAWGVVFASFRTLLGTVGKENIDKFEKTFAENMVCKPLGALTHRGGRETFLFKTGRMAALDIFATAAATAILYTASKFFARMEKQEHPGLKVIAHPIHLMEEFEKEAMPAADQAQEHPPHRKFTDYVTQQDAPNLSTQMAI